MAVITPLVNTQLPVVIALAHRIWPHSYAGILTPAQIEHLLQHIYAETNLQQEIQIGHRFWLAYEDGVPVGFASAYREGDILWLRKLYVLPEMQGRGIGAALTQTATQSFAGAKEMRLLVNKKNLAAQAFYTKTGFQCIEELTVQMGDYHFLDRMYARAI
jgi:ribosomal protein S18 acetylase RimI-like enzyme